MSQASCSWAPTSRLADSAGQMQGFSPSSAADRGHVWQALYCLHSIYEVLHTPQNCAWAALGWHGWPVLYGNTRALHTVCIIWACYGL